MSDNEITRKLAALEMWKTAVVVFLLILTVSITSVQVWLAFRVGAQARDLRAVATETHDALCSFKLDLQTRQEDGRRYLRDVRAGRREIIEGITIQELEESLAARQATLDTLASLDCS